jgi:hypothetical protein
MWRGRRARAEEGEEQRIDVGHNKAPFIPTARTDSLDMLYRKLKLDL